MSDNWDAPSYSAGVLLYVLTVLPCRIFTIISACNITLFWLLHEGGGGGGQVWGLKKIQMQKFPLQLGENFIMYIVQ